MGCSCSSASDRKDSIIQEQTQKKVTNMSKDDHMVALFTKDLQDNPDRFILNNLLSSILFFKNYNTDIYQATVNQVPQTEVNINSLLGSEAKKCILPDILFDKVNENVSFQDKQYQPPKLQPLTARTIYVVNEDIKVMESKDVEVNWKFDQKIYQVRMEVSKVKGYLQLRLSSKFNKTIKQIVGNNEKKKQQEHKIEEEKEEDKVEDTQQDGKIDEAEEETISQEEITKAEKENENQNSKIKMKQEEKGVIAKKEKDDDENYGPVIYSKTPKNINPIKIKSVYNEIPEYCFTFKQENNIHGDENNLFINVAYLNSKEFMSHFTNNLFPNYLGKLLGFNETEIMLATAINGKIFCNFLENDNSKTSCEIIPCVTIKWPFQASEFFKRASRNVIQDYQAGVIYKWPTDPMIKDIKNLHCVIVPRGCVFKRGENPESHLEWEINFPKAERYLESKMTHEQIRCYLFLLTLFKKFIEPATKNQGLLTEHIRNQLFWECEKDPKNWPNDRLGTKLLHVIENLNEGLSKSYIPHYFIKDRNILENIPSKYIHTTQKIFYNILQFPVMHFLKALESLQYLMKEFYPQPDFNKLYEILTKGDHNIQIPLFSKANKTNNDKKQIEIYIKPKGNYDQKIMDHKIKREKENRKKVLINKEKERLQAITENEKNKNDEEDESYLKWTPVDLDATKKGPMLLFFINHFIAIAKTSVRMKLHTQANYYLKLAGYNTKVLKNIAGFIPDARDYEKRIKEQQVLVNKMSFAKSDKFPHLPPPRNLSSTFGHLLYSAPSTSTKSTKPSTVISDRTFKTSESVQQALVDKMTSDNRDVIPLTPPQKSSSTSIHLYYKPSTSSQAPQPGTEIIGSIFKNDKTMQQELVDKLTSVQNDEIPPLTSPQNSSSSFEHLLYSMPSTSTKASQPGTEITGSTFENYKSVQQELVEQITAAKSDEIHPHTPPRHSSSTFEDPIYSMPSTSTDAPRSSTETDDKTSERVHQELVDIITPANSDEIRPLSPLRNSLSTFEHDQHSVPSTRTETPQISTEISDSTSESIQQELLDIITSVKSDEIRPLTPEQNFSSTFEHLQYSVPSIGTETPQPSTEISGSTSESVQQELLDIITPAKSDEIKHLRDSSSTFAHLQYSMSSSRTEEPQPSDEIRSGTEIRGSIFKNDKTDQKELVDKLTSTRPETPSTEISGNTFKNSESVEQKLVDKISSAKSDEIPPLIPPQNSSSTFENLLDSVSSTSTEVHEPSTESESPLKNPESVHEMVTKLFKSRTAAAEKKRKQMKQNKSNDRKKNVGFSFTPSLQQ